jgi:hypothetical protein
MCAYEKIRQNIGFGSLLLSVAKESLSSEKKRLAGYRFDAYGTVDEHLLKFFDARKGNGELCVDDGVDRESVLGSGRFQRLERPGAPRSVVLQNIQQDVRVDKYQSCLATASQSEDLFGPHRHCRSAPQLREAALATLWCPLCRPQRHFTRAGNFKLNSRSRRESKKVSNLLRDGNLSLRRYSGGHGNTLCM